MSTETLSAFKDGGVKVVKNVINGGLYGILVAGAIGAAAMGVMNGLDEQSVDRKIVQSTIVDACMQPGAQQTAYRLKGVSSELAAGMLLRHPKEVQQICAAINASLNEKNNVFADSIQVHALANVLGVDQTVAHAAIETAGFKKDVEERKINIQKTYVNPDWASRPSM